MLTVTAASASQHSLPNSPSVGSIVTSIERAFPLLLGPAVEAARSVAEGQHGHHEQVLLRAWVIQVCREFWLQHDAISKACLCLFSRLALQHNLLHCPLKNSSVAVRPARVYDCKH